MLFVSCFGGTSVVNAGDVLPQTVIENTNRPMTEIISNVAIGELIYNLDSETKTASVVKLVKEDTDNDYVDAVTVPSTVDYEGNTYTVTALETRAFAYRQYLSFVTLPETITSIGEKSFLKCWALESINLPNSIKNIGAQAFKGCECLLEIHLPDNLETLGDEVFYNCPSLRNLQFNDKLKEIPFGAFAYCRNISEFVLPQHLEKIGEQAFYGCETITTLDIPETVTEIGGYAFGTCVGLQNILVPSKVTAIKDGTYINCVGIKSVHIPEQVTEIGYSAFAYCENLEDITIGKNVEFIGATAFNGCAGSFITFEDSDKPCVLDDKDLGYARVSAFEGVQIAELYIGREVQNMYNWSDEFFKKLTLGPNLKVWHNEYCFKNAKEIHSLIKDPKQLVPTFDAKIYEKTKLVVPAGTVEDYAVAEGWSKFMNLADENGATSGIEGITSDDNSVAEYISADGVSAKRPFKGLNIVKYNNGDTKKVFIK